MWGKRLCSIIGDVLSHQGSYWCIVANQSLEKAGYRYMESQDILNKFDPRLSRRGYTDVG